MRAFVPAGKCIIDEFMKDLRRERLVIDNLLSFALSWNQGIDKWANNKKE